MELRLHPAVVAHLDHLQSVGIGVHRMALEPLGDALHGGFRAEQGPAFDAGEGFFLIDHHLSERRIGEVQAGLETYARVGVDAVFGRNLSQNFFLRDPVTGHLMTNVRASDDPSWGFMVGGDVAYVDSSKLLPTSRGYTVKQARTRLRAGIVREAEGGGLFYGITYLGPEFESQREGQVTGSLHLRLNF